MMLKCKEFIFIMKSKVNAYVSAAGLILVFIGFFMPFEVVFGSMNVIFSAFGQIIRGPDILFCFFGPLSAAAAAALAFAQVKNGDFLRKLFTLIATAFTLMTLMILGEFARITSPFLVITGIGLVAAWVGMYLDQLGKFFSMVGKKIACIITLAK